jgi:hypothetical protein
MSAELPVKKCPACGETDLAEGRIGTYLHTFVPNEWSFWTMSKGFQPKAFVCLSCGFFGQFLEEQDLKKLRAENK